MNLENLRPLTKAQAREVGRKGGLISGKKRKEAKHARELLKSILLLPLSEAQVKLKKMANTYGLEEKGLNQKTLMMLAAVLKAQNGDIKALEVVLDLIGELPAKKAEISGPKQGPVEVITGEMTDEALRRARQIATAALQGRDASNVEYKNK